MHADSEAPGHDYVLCRMREGDLPNDSRVVVATEGMAFRSIMDNPLLLGFSTVCLVVDDASASLEAIMGWAKWVSFV